VGIETVSEVRSAPRGQPWAGMATWNPFWGFGKFSRPDKDWTGWIYAVDADTGVWKWRLNRTIRIFGAVAPTAGGIVFVGDAGGNFYALDAANGQKLWGQDLGAAIAGGGITYAADGAETIAVAVGVTDAALPVRVTKSKVVVLGLDGASASR
jgi:alcohol dehydrogenase (cytochrome c)